MKSQWGPKHQDIFSFGFHRENKKSYRFRNDMKVRNWWHNLHFWHFQGTWWSQCDVSCLWERQPCVLLFYGYENMIYGGIYGGGVHGWAIRKRSQVCPKYCCKLVSCWGYRIPQTHQTAAGVSQGNMPRQSWIHTLTRKIFTGVIFNIFEVWLNSWFSFLRYIFYPLRPLELN